MLEREEWQGVGQGLKCSVVFEPLSVTHSASDALPVQLQEMAASSASRSQAFHWAWPPMLRMEFYLRPTTLSLCSAQAGLGARAVKESRSASYRVQPTISALL